MTEPLFRHIFTPVDLGDSSIAPLQFTAAFAKKFDASVSLFYADELATLYAEYDPAWIAYHVAPGEELVRLENSVRTMAEEYFRGLPSPEVIVQPGHPVNAIVKFARERNADLIIMGTHGRRGWRRALVGSVADGVVRGAAQPVLVVPERHDGRPFTVDIKRIVCPVNFSEAARDALQYAASVAGVFDAELTLVHVAESATAELDVPAIEEMFRAWLPENLQQRSEFRQLVLRGGPAERVLDCVEDMHADLLVIGAQVKWLRSESVVGTTSERLLRFSPVPILTVSRHAATLRDIAESAASRQSEG